MRLKKKIIRRSFDYKAEADYYREAKVCPNCGNRQEFSKFSEMIVATANNSLTIIEGMLEGGGRAYTCKRCGCQWEVKKFK